MHTLIVNNKSLQLCGFSMVQISKRLKQLRGKRSYNAFGKAINISGEKLRHMERGEDIGVNTTTLRRLKEALNVSYDQLMEWLSH